MNISGIRYKINKTTEYFNLADCEKYEDMMSSGEILVNFEHFKNIIYFVDILETTKGPMVKMKIYMPNGDFVIGWQMRDNLDLHYDNGVNRFDGRFNS